MCLRYCQYEQLNDARRKFDENYEQQEQLRQLYDPSLLIDTLAYAAADAEREAERQAESFLEGELSCSYCHLQCYQLVISGCTYLGTVYVCVGTSDADTFNKQFMRLQMVSLSKCNKLLD